VLFATAIMLAVTAAALAIARRLNLGSIAGLLLVGIILGPHSPVPLFTSHVADFQAIGAIGVVLLLFIVGLETQPHRLWSLRTLVFGFGLVEYALCVALIALLLIAATRINWQSTLILGLALAMSSSAVPLPILQLRGESDAPHGRLTLAADILQSLILVPVMVVVPLLGPAGPADAIVGALRVIKAVAALSAVVVLGRLVMPALLTLAARRGHAHGFRLVVLAGVCAAAWMMDRAGASMALGAFVVGVLLSTSRHAQQIKAAVVPARQLLLGIFFIAVGMAIDLNEAASFHSQLLFYLAAVLVLKWIAVFASARLFRADARTAALCGLLLMPLDEVGYVIFAAALATGLLSARAATLALLSISFSFVVTPVVISWALRAFSPQRSRERLSRAGGQGELADCAERIAVVGYGEVGQMLCRILREAGIPYLGFETDVERVEEARRRGEAIAYGDLSDPEAIATARLGQARLVVIAHEDFAHCRDVFTTLRIAAPEVGVMIGVQSRSQRDTLCELGARWVLTLAEEGALALSAGVLAQLSVAPGRTQALLKAHRAEDLAVSDGGGLTEAVSSHVRCRPPAVSRSTPGPEWGPPKGPK